MTEVFFTIPNYVALELSRWLAEVKEEKEALMGVIMKHNLLFSRILTTAVTLCMCKFSLV